MDDGADAGGTGMYRLRRSARPFCLNRGNPTQEGEQVGVAFLLVTFLWPRKEKSLAKPRSGGETPSRTESSCPARRSRANQASDPSPQPSPARGEGMVTADDYAPLIDPTRPHPLIPSPISQGARGSFTPVQCAPLIGTLPLTRQGEGMVTADDYALLIDPTRPDSTIPIAPSVVSAWGHGQSPGG